MQIFIKKKMLINFLKKPNILKRPFLKYVNYDLLYLKFLAQNKQIKKFKFFKKLRKFKFPKKKQKFNYGAFLQFIFNKTYVNNFFRYLLYNWNLNLKSYYKLTVINFRKQHRKNYYDNLLKTKKINFFNFPYLIVPKQSYLNLLTQFIIIICILYKTKYLNLFNDFFIIKGLLNKFKYFLIKLIDQ
jgi:hypothetical protein